MFAFLNDMKKRQETDKIRQCYMDELVKKCRDHGIKQMILEVPKFLMVKLTKNLDVNYLTSDNRNKG